MRYITIGDWDLDDIYLESDKYCNRAMEKMLQTQSDEDSEQLSEVESASPEIIDRHRNAWIDLSLVVQRKLEAYACVQKPRVASPPKKIAPGSSSSSSLPPVDLASTGGSTSSPFQSLRSVSPSKSSTPKRVAHIQSHNSALLLKLDVTKTGEVPIRKNDPQFETVRSSYSQWCRGVQNDFRRLGVMLLQLISHRPFTTREKKSFLTMQLAESKAPKIVKRKEDRDSSAAAGDSKTHCLLLSSKLVE